MGHGFGELYKLHGIITYRLSPFEQRAFAKAFSAGVPRTIRRCLEEAAYIVPPFTLAYLIFDFAEKKHEFLKRKVPGQFDHEVDEEPEAGDEL